MFVISKKALRFVLRDKNKAAVDTRIVRPGIMTQLPEWVKNDELFKLAEKEGTITFVEHKKVTNVPDVPDVPKDPPKDDEEKDENNGEGGEGGDTEKTNDPLKTDGGENANLLPPDEIAKMDRVALLEYAAKIGIEGIGNRISDANLVIRVNEFIAAKIKGD
jgi:hypothetical protein